MVGCGRYLVNLINNVPFSVAETGYRTETEMNGWAWAYAGETAEWAKEEGALWRQPGSAQSDSHPVTYVSWHDTQAFIQWLNRREKTSRSLRFGGGMRRR